MPARCSLNSSVINWAMLRFRPIAPKPSGGEPLSAFEDREGAVVKNNRRTKRKYVRVRDRRRTTKAKKGRGTGRPSPAENSGVEDGSSPEKGGLATLQLMPERSGSEKSCDNSNVQKVQEKNRNLSTADEVNNSRFSVSETVVAAAAAGSPRSVIKTWIIVECVTDTVVGESGVGLGFSDWEKINSLRSDTCPGFVSDGSHNVVWVNDAYRKMVGVGQHGIMVWLAVKQELPKYSPSFACRVRMSQETREGRVWHRLVACDVSRMEFAGFAWKLDITTALGLGLPI